MKFRASIYTCTQTLPQFLRCDWFASGHMMHCQPAPATVERCALVGRSHDATAVAATRYAQQKLQMAQMFLPSVWLRRTHREIYSKSY